jgi:hypothetical protein
LGQRSRKRRAVAGAGDGPPAPNGGDPTGHGRPGPTPRGYARSRARDDAVRESLEPLAPGERPGAVTIAAILAAAIAVANLALYLAGWEVSGRQPSLLGVLAFCAIMLAAAIGMWQRRYWAVLGFEVLLGITLVLSSLWLLFASNWQGALLCVVVIALAGPLFWKLVRAMARIQMPSRPLRGNPPS